MAVMCSKRPFGSLPERPGAREFFMTALSALRTFRDRLKQANGAVQRTHPFDLKKTFASGICAHRWDEYRLLVGMIKNSTALTAIHLIETRAYAPVGRGIVVLILFLAVPRCGDVR